MPFINITTSVRLDGPVRDQVREAAYESILLVPGKTREVTMVQLRDCADISKAGTGEPAMFIEARMFTRPSFDAKQAFVKDICARLSALTGVAPAQIYVNVLEFYEWGSNGDYRSY
jgi:phenylpyruvate tautomerase PptA (4-oxalocrotonate tautomerase family)